MHGTRTVTDAYQHEMTDERHRQLLELVRSCKGKIVLSGYPSELYDQVLHDWRCEERQIDNKAQKGKTKREMTERVWMNF